MTRVHDMGGRFGDGPVDASEKPSFKAEWEARCHALVTASMPLGGWNIDQRRHGRELLPPASYMGMTYYEKWVAGLADMLEGGGVVSRPELSGDATPSPKPELVDQKITAQMVAQNFGKRVPYTRDIAEAPLFQAGDLVVTRARSGNAFVPGGHTRLPGYAAGLQGRVMRYHGAHVLPDTNAHDLGECPEPLYAIAFAAGDLWAKAEHPRDEVIVDLWQSYLTPA